MVEAAAQAVAFNTFSVAALLDERVDALHDGHLSILSQLLRDTLKYVEYAVLEAAFNSFSVAAEPGP